MEARGWLPDIGGNTPATCPPGQQRKSSGTLLRNIRYTILINKTIISIRLKDISLILLTGDYPAHDVWNQSKEDNLETTRVTIEAIKAAFPSVKVLPSLGNHEAFPCNMYATYNTPAEFSMDWLFLALSNLYSDWLSPQARASLELDGRYVEIIAPGFRVLSINSLMCYTFNL